MEQSRLTQLPADLTNLLARRLYWRDLYTIITSQPEFFKYQNPEHLLWRQLYHRDISTYPLPESSDYQQQYFWSQDLLERLQQEPLQGQIEDLVKRGYDRALEGLLAEHPEANQLNLSTAFYRAAGRGYLTILKILDTFQPGSHYRVDGALAEAARMGHLDVVEYIIETRGVNLEDAIWTATYAAEKGHANIVEYVFNYIKQRYPEAPHVTIQRRLLNSAFHSDNLELIQRLTKGIELDVADTLDWLWHSQPHLVVALYLIDQLPLNQQSNYTRLVVTAAARDCQLEYLKYLHADGVDVSPAVKVAVDHCSDPELHQWLISVVSANILAEALTRLFRHQPAELGLMYVKALPQSVLSGAKKYEWLSSLLYNPSKYDPEALELMTRLMDGGALPNSTIVQTLLYADASLFNPDVYHYLLDQLSSHEQIKVLLRKGVPSYNYLLSKYEYTPEQYVDLLLNLYFMSGDIHQDDHDELARLVLQKIPTQLKPRVAELLAQSRRADPEYIRQVAALLF